MWLDKQVSIYNCLADNTGRPMSYRDILFTQFSMEHPWFYKDHNSDHWKSGTSNDIDTIVDLRTQDLQKPEKTLLKATMQCFTPAGVLKSKKKGEIVEISRSGLMQFDFDYGAIKDYDIEELKQAVFDLPFIAFCGLSCSGSGFYALALIAEPYRLHEYAEHCFEVLDRYGIPADTSKGRNVNDLRFVSYDCNMLIRENPEPLRIKRFTSKQTKTLSQPLTPFTKTAVINDKIADTGLNEIKSSVVGARWQTVQKWSFTLGGLNDITLLDAIKNTIQSSAQFAGEATKYCECAEVCFNAGRNQPLAKTI